MPSLLIESTDSMIDSRKGKIVLYPYARAFGLLKRVETLDSVSISVI